MKIQYWLPMVALLISGTCFADLAGDICSDAQYPDKCTQIITQICQNPQNCANLTQQIQNCKGDKTCIKAAVEAME